MNYGHLSILLQEAQFSPEQLGERLGIAGRTLRRWESLPKNEELPTLYAAAFRESVLELVAEGRLSTEAKIVQIVLAEGKDTAIFAALKNLGVGQEFLEKSDQSEGSIVEGVAQIGSSERKQATVNRSTEKIFSHIKLGTEWKFRVQTLYKAITSKELSKFEKFAAYGALFYLLSPFDLIPDHIPVFGLMDDYVILGIVVTYYLKRFPNLFKGRSAKA